MLSPENTSVVLNFFFSQKSRAIRTQNYILTHEGFSVTIGNSAL